MPESTITDPDKPSVQVGDNSAAVGSLSVGGSVEGSMIIGSHNVVGFTSDQVLALVTQISTTFQVKPFDGQCPYKGLDAFQEEDAELFFGREKLLEDLIARLESSRTIFITGPSGSGKSSLVRAGLIHALRQGALKESNSDRWLYTTLKPGRNPLDATAIALSRLKSPELGNYFKEHVDQNNILYECVESALSDNSHQRFTLFIDQFEEIFTNTPEPLRSTFLNLLTQAATTERGRLIVIFSMRSDFIPNCATHPQLNKLLNQQFVQIGAMQSEELVSAIAQPALRVGLKIDPDLIAQIINDMKGEPGALPLMQFALKDLFEAEQAEGDMIELTLKDYLQRGGIQKSLERHADTAFAELNPHEQDLARNIFSGLIEIGRGTVDTRRTASTKELIPAGEQNHEVEAVVQKLANARLITTDKVNVTISHEKLIDAWPWLKKLVNENRDIIALRNEIAANAKEWEAHNCDSSYLYTGARLLNARERLASKQLILSGLTRNFVDAAIQMEERHQQDEERRHQKELDDARKLAATERRGRLIGRWMLVVAGILIATLGYISKEPIRNEIWRQQLMKSSMVKIPAGDYTLGDTQANDYPFSFLRYQKYPMSAYAIDTTPVTNRSYGLCIQAGICSRPEAMQSEYTGIQMANKYVVNITAVNAAQYCSWIGRRLPSEKEWELAMRREVLKPIDPNALTDPISFFEWTTSQYDQYATEWLDISIDPPEVLIQRGGQLDSDTFITLRQNQGSMISANSGGFRCAIDQ